jgi:hypothetical protein
MEAITNTPEHIWIEDNFGDGEGDKWAYATWDDQSDREYDIRYVRADIVQALTAERDRLRKELENIADDCEAEYPPSHGAIKYAIRMALKGE